MRNEQIHENEQLSVLNTETVQDMFQIRSNASFKNVFEQIL